MIALPGRTLITSIACDAGGSQHGFAEGEKASHRAAKPRQPLIDAVIRLLVTGRIRHTVCGTDQLRGRGFHMSATACRTVFAR